MTIQTKYNIGDRVWVIYETKKEVGVYDDFIAWITYDDGEISYGLKESCEDLNEKDIILYEETDKMAEKVKKIMQEIRDKE